MRYKRMPIEVESPEEFGYGRIRYNLSESSTTDRTVAGLRLSIPDLTLLYGEHRGSAELRTLVAAADARLRAADVLLTAGAASALFIIATSLLRANDHLVVLRPNYATNIETPRAIGCDISFVDLTWEMGFRIDIEAIEAAITDRTRLVSITCPHNPTGVNLSDADLAKLVEITRQRGCHLLVDETYRDLSFGAPLPVAAALGEHVISVSSLSKAYGVPGIRMGWLITRDAKLQEQFLAAKEQISICGSVIDEWIGLQVMAARDTLLPPLMADMARRLELVAEWVESEPLIDWARPAGGVVCFPKMVEAPAGGTEGFYRRLVERESTYVGPGHWFDMPNHFFRLGFGWSTFAELEGGLGAVSRALRG